MRPGSAASSKRCPRYQPAATLPALRRARYSLRVVYPDDDLDDVATMRHPQLVVARVADAHDVVCPGARRSGGSRVLALKLRAGRAHGADADTSAGVIDAGSIGMPSSSCVERSSRLARALEVAGESSRSGSPLQPLGLVVARGAIAFATRLRTSASSSSQRRAICSLPIALDMDDSVHYSASASVLTVLLGAKSSCAAVNLWCRSIQQRTSAASISGSL